MLEVTAYRAKAMLEVTAYRAKANQLQLRWYLNSQGWSSPSSSPIASHFSGKMISLARSQGSQAPRPRSRPIKLYRRKRVE